MVFLCINVSGFSPEEGLGIESFHGAVWLHNGILTVGSVAKEEGWEVRLWDEVIQGPAPIESLVEKDAVVGLSLVVTGIQRGLDLAKRAKRAGALAVVVGNDQASFRVEQLNKLGDQLIDGVFVGDDLSSARLFFREVTSEKELPSALAKVRIGRPAIAPTEYFVAPALELYPDSTWNQVWRNYSRHHGFEFNFQTGRKNALINLAKGCTRNNACSYCGIYDVLSQAIPTNKYLEQIVDEYSRFGITDYYSSTDSLYGFRKVAKQLLDIGARFESFTMYARAVEISARPEWLKLWREVAPQHLKFNIGLDSGDEQILLHGIEKGHGIETIRDCVRILRSEGVHLHCSFIIGSPGETERSANNTAEFILWLKEYLGPLLVNVEVDYYWLNFGSPAARILTDYASAQSLATSAGNTLSHSQWRSSFYQFKNELVLPISVQESWYQYFTQLDRQQAHQDFIQPVIDELSGARSPTLTGRSFAEEGLLREYKLRGLGENEGI